MVDQSVILSVFQLCFGFSVCFCNLDFSCESALRKTGKNSWYDLSTWLLSERLRETEDIQIWIFLFTQHYAKLKVAKITKTLMAKRDLTNDQSLTWNRRHIGDRTDQQHIWPVPLLNHSGVDVGQFQLLRQKFGWTSTRPCKQLRFLNEFDV